MINKNNKKKLTEFKIDGDSIKKLLKAYERRKDIPLWVYADKLSDELKKEIIEAGDENVRVIRTPEGKIEVCIYEGIKSRPSIFEADKHWNTLYE